MPSTGMEYMDPNPRQLDPREVLDRHRFLEYEQALDRTWRLDQLVDLIDSPKTSILDVGGASGFFLSELANRAKFEGTVLEVEAAYETQLADPGIAFIHGSVVDNDLPAEVYDIVTFQHVLHHLVSDSVGDTRRLQEKGLAEMLRLTKPGGYVVFEEEVNLVKPFARLVYLLSRWANRVGIRVKFFEAGQVVVAFPTRAEIDRHVDRITANGAGVVLERGYIPWQMSWRWRLTLLMAWVGSATVVIQKTG